MDAVVTAAWWEQGMAVLDTETTARDPEEALLASICFALIRPAERAVEMRSALVDVEMPEEASKVNGLTTERLRAEGGKAAEVLDVYCGDIALALHRGIPLVIMNAPYDLTVLDRDARRHGIPTISERLDGRPVAPVVDPGVLDKRVVKYRRRVSEDQGARCLKTLAQVHGVGWDDDLAHTAEYDAMQAGRVVWQLMRRFPLLAQFTPEQLHVEQICWYREQAEGLAAYWFKQANELEHQAGRVSDDAERTTLLGDAEQLRQRADGVSTEWPLRPWVEPTAVQPELAA
jgi:DNA polymerase-3 subunit epsilon